MKKYLAIAALTALVVFVWGILLIPVSAHPGRTDQYGCHTCRTNCPRWGLSFGEYHCHKSKGLPQPKPPIKSKRTLQKKQAIQTGLEAKRIKEEQARLETETRAAGQADQIVPPPNTILCNNAYWTMCPVGQDFVCPTSGKAYCQLPPQQNIFSQNTTQQQKATVCNGVSYTSCPAGSDFVCPNSGSVAYCQQNQLQQQAQETERQRQAEQQRLLEEVSRRRQEEQAKVEQVNNLIVEYQNKVNEIDQEILGIKQSYYSEVEKIKNQTISMGFINGQIQSLTNGVNEKIQKLQLQKESFRLEYLRKVNDLR